MVTPTNDQVKRTLRLYWLPLIVLILGLLSTGIISWVLHRAVEGRDRAAFDHSVQRTALEITGRIHDYLTILRATAGFISASEDISRDEFRRYVSRLRLEKNYPGVQGIGYSMRIKEADLERVQGELASDYAGFRVWPQDPRPEFHSIVFLEPLDARNAAAIGFDMFTEPKRRAAMESAALTGYSAATGKVTLVQEIDEDQQAGFLVYIPVYEGGGTPVSHWERMERLIGFAYSPFRTSDLLNGIATEGQLRVGFDIYDGDTPAPEHLLYSTIRQQGHNPRMKVLVPLDITGRTWTVAFFSTSFLEATSNRNIVFGVLVTGSILSILLAGLVELQQRNQRSRERLLEAERAAREHVENMSRMKDEFLATLSHELRTPMTAIMGWAELLHDGSLHTSEMKEGLEVIERNAVMQSRLIDDLLDMSRIISGRLHLSMQEVLFEDVLDSAIESVSGSAEQKSVRILQNVDTAGRSLRGDPHRLQQVLWNLLVNAVKFSYEGGRIEVAARVRGAFLQVLVIDNGEGMDPKFLPYVFERFRQADSSSTRKFGGLGLGLAIVKSIVDLHGGSISAESSGKGRGATFRLRLPLSVERPAGSTAPVGEPASQVAQKPGSLAGFKILVVEDEKDARDLVARVLRSTGAEVFAMADAESGLKKFNECQPDLIVSDIGMPGTDGYQFISKVKSLSDKRGGEMPPAIALTAFARVQDQKRSLEAGFQMHVTKPVRPAVLLDACYRFCRPLGGSDSASSRSE